jgi:hypothetical protein
MGVSKADQAVAENIITLDRRAGDRRTVDRRTGKPDALDTSEIKVPCKKKQRRRHIDPTTCERDYSDHEIEFMRAMDDYKRDSGRMFPTCSEVLEVIRALGYHKLTDEQVVALGLAEIGQPNDTESREDGELEDEESEEAFADA